MADNRIYLYCPVCKEYYSIGKCLYDSNIYLPVTTDEEVKKYSEGTYGWMSKHFTDCYGDRFYKGEIFKVLTEYDERIT